MAIVLKSDSSPERVPAARSVTGLAGFNLNDLADEGRTRLDQCREQIRLMLDEAKEEAKRIKKVADERGYEEGLTRAAVDADTKLKQEADARAKNGLQVIEKAVKQLHATHEDWMKQYAATLTKTALAASEKIVRHRLESEPEILVKWASEALHSTRSASSLTLAVNPESIAQLGKALDQILASSDLPEQAHVEPDETVPIGEVVVRQVGGTVEAGLMAQLQRLEELLS